MVLFFLVIIVAVRELDWLAMSYFSGWQCFWVHRMGHVSLHVLIAGELLDLVVLTTMLDDDADDCYAQEDCKQGQTYADEYKAD